MGKKFEAGRYREPTVGVSRYGARKISPPGAADRTAFLRQVDSDGCSRYRAKAEKLEWVKFTKKSGTAENSFVSLLRVYRRAEKEARDYFFFAKGGGR